MKRILVMTAVAAGAVTITGVASGAAAKKTSGTAWVCPTHAEGKTLYVAGDIKDSLLGRGTIVYVTKVRPNSTGAIVITARRVTISTTKGSMSGTGNGTQVTSADGKTTEVRDGSFTLTRGTGAYKGHTYRGTFSGPLTGAVYTFKYKGRYR